MQTDDKLLWFQTRVALLEQELAQTRVQLQNMTECRRVEQAFAYEKAFLDAAIEVLPLPLAFITTDFQIIRLSLAAREMTKRLGLTRITDIKMLDPQTRIPLSRNAMPLIRALRGEVVNAEESILRVRKQGVEVSCLISAAPIRVDGRVVAAVMLYEDITALKEADRAKDEFLAVLSHELQTPLTSILGWSELTLTHNSPEFLLQAMEIVRRNARRQKELIADMLDMSHLVYRKFTISSQWTDLNEQVRAALEDVQQRAQEQQITIIFQPSSIPLTINADPSRLLQCIDNLLMNSLKFTPMGGTVTVTCRQQDATGLLSIRDTGRGLTPSELTAVFKPFHRANRGKQTSGLGLGLAIVRGIIELHGGRVWAESPGIDQGSTFTLALPLCHNSQQEI